MKTTLRHQLSILFMLTMAISGCKQNDPIVPNTKIYWDNNYLFLNNIHGLVKTMSIGTITYNFNKEGYISSITDTNGNYKANYTYNANNQLIQIIVQSDSYNTIESYTYGTHGKYVPQYVSSVYLSLIKNLTNYSNVHAGGKFSVDYISKGDSLLMIYKYFNTNPTPFEIDTVHFAYKGKFPYKAFYPTANMQYDVAENGMFNSSEDHFLSKNKADSAYNKYQFTNTDRQLMSHAENYSFFSGNTTHTYTDYTYNTYDDPIGTGVTGTTTSQQGITYEYDDSLNWVKGVSVNIVNGVPNTTTTIRTFTYW